MYRIIALWIALVTLLSSSSVGADRVGLVVRTPEVAPATTGELIGALALAGRRNGLEVVRGPFAAASTAVEAGAVRERRLTEFARVHELIGEGMRAYQSADPEFAVSRLSEARRLALSVADLDGGIELIAEVSLRLGVARLELGQARSHSDFQLAARLAPSRPVTLAEFKPSVVAAYRSAKKGRGAKPMRLDITTPSVSAAIAVDGATPTTSPWMGSVTAGVHLVVATAPGRRPLASLVEVTRHHSLKLALDDDPERLVIHHGRETLSIGTTDAEASVAAEALMTFAELDGLLLATAVWRRGAPTLIAEWCAGVPVRCRRTVELRYAVRGNIEAAARELWSRAMKQEGSLSPGLLMDSRLVNPDPAPGRTVRGDKRHWAQNPVVWAGAAAGVAVILAATILWVRDDERRPEVIVEGDLFPSP